MFAALFSFLVAIQRGMMLAVLFDGWRPYAYVLGWEIWFRDGERGAHVDRVWVSRKRRGSLGLLRRLCAEWDRSCRERGIRISITPIEKSRPAVAHVGIRAAGYRYYREDRRFRWYFHVT